MSSAGVKKFVLAVNKMDLVDYGKAKFDAITADFAEFANSIGINAFTAIPMSGLKGDNIATQSESTAWYSGSTLISHLECVDLDQNASRTQDFRMPVQWVNRPNLDFRDLAARSPRAPSNPEMRCAFFPQQKPVM